MLIIYFLYSIYNNIFILYIKCIMSCCTFCLHIELCVNVNLLFLMDINNNMYLLINYINTILIINNYT